MSGAVGDSQMGYALLLAAMIHGLGLIGVGFVPDPREEAAHPRQVLKVALVRAPATPAERVKDPDLLAQVSREGSGNPGRTQQPAEEIVGDVSEPRSAIIAPALPPPRPAAPASTVPTQPAEAVAVPASSPAPATPDKLTARTAETKTRQSRRQSAKQPGNPGLLRMRETRPDQPANRVTAAQLLASRGEEIARLTAELDRKSAAYANRPRRKAISASTTEYRYAAYLDAWRRKVERIGNLNYPDEARRKRLYGNLVLHVAVRSDGSIERIRLLHSSGHKLLDDAAIRIVRLAAPFAPFPPDVLEETDVLDITRTWQFLSENRLGWDE
jgi:protein TonB